MTFATVEVDAHVPNFACYAIVAQQQAASLIDDTSADTLTGQQKNQAVR